MTTQHTDEMREAFETKIKATPFTGDIKWDGEKYTNAWVQGQWQNVVGETMLSRYQDALREAGVTLRGISGRCTPEAQLTVDSALVTINKLLGESND